MLLDIKDEFESKLTPVKYSILEILAKPTGTSDALDMIICYTLTVPMPSDLVLR